MRSNFSPISVWSRKYRTRLRRGMTSSRWLLRSLRMIETLLRASQVPQSSRHHPKSETTQQTDRPLTACMKYGCSTRRPTPATSPSCATLHQDDAMTRSNWAFKSNHWSQHRPERQMVKSSKNSHLTSCFQTTNHQLRSRECWKSTKFWLTAGDAHQTRRLTYRSITRLSRIEPRRIRTKILGLASLRFRRCPCLKMPSLSHLFWTLRQEKSVGDWAQRHWKRLTKKPAQNATRSNRTPSS